MVNRHRVSIFPGRVERIFRSQRNSAFQGSVKSRAISKGKWAHSGRQIKGSNRTRFVISQKDMASNNWRKEMGLGCHRTRQHSPPSDPKEHLQQKMGKEKEYFPRCRSQTRTWSNSSWSISTKCETRWVNLLSYWKEAHNLWRGKVKYAFSRTLTHRYFFWEISSI